MKDYVSKMLLILLAVCSIGCDDARERRINQINEEIQLLLERRSKLSGPMAGGSFTGGAAVGAGIATGNPLLIFGGLAKLADSYDKADEMERINNKIKQLEKEKNSLMLRGR